MEPQTYRCPRFPHYSISRGLGLPSIQFLNGRFIAKTEGERDAIEANEWFGLYITVDQAKPEPAAGPSEAEYRAAFEEITESPPEPPRAAIPEKRKTSRVTIPPRKTSPTRTKRKTK